MKLNYRVAILIVAMLFGIVLSIPSLANMKEGPKVTLGLDLQGGLQMLLGVKTQDAATSRIKSIAASIKHYTSQHEILIANLNIHGTSTSFDILDSDDAKHVSKFLDKLKGVKVTHNKDNYTVTLTASDIKKIEKQAVSQAIETIRNRLDQFGLAEPLVQRQNKSDILVELPGIKTATEANRARKLISRPAKLELMAVDESRESLVNSMTPSQAAAYGDVILHSSTNPKIKYLVNEIPILNGSMLTNAKVSFNKNNRPVIDFTLNSEGAQIFGDFTGKNIGHHLAIVLDNKVYSAPVINERIGGGNGQISGDYTVAGAEDLAIALRSGALPAPVYIMEQRSVGPSLGAQSIKESLMALIGGFVLVFSFMIIYYRAAGLIANIALIANLFLIIAIMALFGATLTLPGMAGIVLTVGMAVDSNVIINERIRELLREGASIKKAIEEGYSNAMRAILDANITTLIAAVVLYIYGTGTIKGFAITMTIGILVSMVTAILGTHGIYQMIESKIAKSKNNLFWFGIKD